MTPRSIRRAQERKALKEQERKAKLLAVDNPAFNEPDLSEAKLQANRANAQLSTGPKSGEGKAKVSLNAVKTGLTGRTVLLPSDDAAEYERHVQAFADEYSPVGPRESDLVQSIADSWWRMKRIPCLESALLAHGYLELADSFDQHDPSVRPSLIAAQAFLKYERQIRNLQLQEARLYRRYEKDKAELGDLQQARRSREAEALEQAAALYKDAQLNNQPFHPADFGFEFSNVEIEQHLRRSEARDLRLAAAKTRAQAA